MTQMLFMCKLHTICKGVRRWQSDSRTRHLDRVVQSYIRSGQPTCQGSKGHDGSRAASR